VVKGIGDDCAVVDAGRGMYTLLTSDMIVEGVDFRRGEKPELVGRKALAVNLSDIAACGGIPQYALVSLGLPAASTVEAVTGMYRGMSRLAREFGMTVVGGDISRAPALTVDVSLHGSVEKENLVLREGAQEGDIILATGSFGGSIKGRHLRFTPRVKEARYLVNNFRVNAMIDSSDGLAQDLGHILEKSRAGCVLFESLIPQSKDSRGIDDALHSGEDFELIFTADRENAEAMLRSRRFLFSAIGSVTRRGTGMRMVDRGGRVRRVEPRGWRHF
jgi:thiamine-monophosphate kinase